MTDAKLPADTPQMALAGVRVLDLSRVLAGPFCGALLGDMGADVMKIEDTAQGDESRGWLPQKMGQSAAYLVNNRNKRGIAINLKKPEGVEIVKRLVADADVLIENFRTGTMEAFGLGYEILAELNPQLIYCSVSAFGRTGPRAQEGGYEALMQAFSGIMSSTGEADGAPVRSGVSFLDITTGVLCAFGIVSALAYRARTGLGQRVDGSLFGTAMSVLNFQAEGYLLSGEVPQRMGSAHPAIAPYRNFKCADGQWIFIAGANDRLTRRLMTALGLAWVCEDARFLTNGDRVRNREEVERIVAEAIALHDRDELLKLFKEAKFPAAPVNTVAQALTDPQIEAKGLVWQMEHPRLGSVPVVGFPIDFSAMQTSIRRHAPEWGEHTDETLAELGFSPAEVATLRAGDVVK